MNRLVFQVSPAICWACLLLLMCLSCNDEGPAQPSDPFTFKVPGNFPQPTYTFDNNPVTQEGFELGRALFYDPLLSRDGSVSCNNCHIQATAFADSPVHPVSIGIDNKHGIRNAPSITNLAFYPEFFWDGGVTHLDFVPINAIESDFEMDESVENVVTKLNASATYRQLFHEAFGIDEITLPYTLYALSQFTSMMISANSRYDKFVRDEGEDLTSTEREGMEIFRAKCGTCHSGELFTDFSYRNNGLDSTYEDLGRNRITSLASDLGKFRVPSLRNVAISAPYMHNARFSTLEEVLEHYTDGVVPSATLDPLLISQGKTGIVLSGTEKEAILAFLKTLTDIDFVQNPIFFSP